MDWLWKFLASWLSDRTLWVPVGAIILLLPQILQWLKRLLQVSSIPWIVEITKGWGPRIVNALIALVTVLITATGDGALSALEGVQAILAFLIALGVQIGVVEGLYRVAKKTYPNPGNGA